MNKIKEPRFSKEDIGANPFCVKLKIEVNRVTFEKQYARDKDGVWLPVEKELEVAQSCKVYISKENRGRIFLLSPRAKELMMWLIYESESNSEWIWINKVRFMKESKISSINTYKGALRELIKLNYIQASVIKDTYWINPECFFNGNRVNVFTENIVRK